MLQDYSELDETYKDILKELGNIGTGNALTSLSRMTNKPIQMKLPQIRIVDRDKLDEILNYRDSFMTNVMIEVHGDLECVVTFLLNETFTRIIAEDLTGETLENISEMSELQESAVREIGNIMCNSYLNALAVILEAKLTVSVPKMRVGHGEDSLLFTSAEYRDDKPELLFIKNTFYYLEQEFVSYILLQPRFRSLQKILAKLE